LSEIPAYAKRTRIFQLNIQNLTLNTAPTQQQTLKTQH